MKSARAAAMLVLTFSCTGVVDAADFTGTWAFNATVGEPPLIDSKPVCVLTQVGKTIGGPCKGPGASGSSVGVVSGRTITLKWHHVKSGAMGLTGVATFRGVWKPGDAIRGTAADSLFPDIPGAFSARKIR